MRIEKTRTDYFSEWGQARIYSKKPEAEIPFNRVNPCTVSRINNTLILFCTIARHDADGIGLYFSYGQILVNQPIE